VNFFDKKQDREKEEIEEKKEEEEKNNPEKKMRKRRERRRKGITSGRRRPFFQYLAETLAKKVSFCEGFSIKPILFYSFTHINIFTYVS
jgi:hypothetical protein